MIKYLALLLMSTGSFVLCGQSTDFTLDSAEKIVKDFYLDADITFINNQFLMDGFSVCNDVKDSITDNYGVDSLIFYLKSFESGEQIDIEVPPNIETEYIAFVSQTKHRQFSIRVYSTKEFYRGEWYLAEYRNFSFILNSNGEVTSYCTNYLVH